MSESPSNELSDAIEYLVENDGSTDSKKSVVMNIVASGEASPTEVLAGFADELSTAGAIYPMEQSQLSELRDSINDELSDETLPSLEEICHPNTIIDSKDDVIAQAISIYDDDNITPNQRKENIETLIEQARRDGHDVEPNEVAKRLEEFEQQAAENGSEELNGDLLGEDEGVDLNTEIQTEKTIFSEKETTYSIDLGIDNVAEINWFVSGEKIGEGSEVTYTHSHSGSQTVSVEVKTTEDEKAYESKSITVEEKPAIGLNIIGLDEVDTGEEVSYRVDTETTNEIINELQWEINGVKCGTDNSVSTVFNNAGDNTIEVTAHGKKGTTETDTKEVTVNTPTDISVSLNTPDVVYEGETETIYASISVENTVVEEVSCKVGSEDIYDIEPGNNVSFEYTFEEKDEYPVTFTATNSDGGTDNDVGTVDCYVEPDVEWENTIDSIVRGDREELRVDYDNRLTTEWDVEYASIQHVSNEIAVVEFNPDMRDKSFVNVEVSNENGDTKEISKRVEILDPSVDVEINHPDEVTENEEVELNIDGTEVENAEITEVGWLVDDEFIAKGESIEYSFRDSGTREVTVRVDTDRMVDGEETGEVIVNPETDITAVIVQTGGDTTRDEFTFSGEQSKTEHTSIMSYKWEISEVNGEEVVHGKQVSKQFTSPGEYDVTLTVESADGDVDTETISVSVEQFTDVTAEITGDDTVIVGEETNYTAIKSKPINTKINSYTWKLNDNIVGSGEEFSETFSNPGHFTLDLVVETVTGDTDTDSINVVVSTPDSVIEPDIAIKGDDVPRVGEVVTITSEPSVVKNGKIKQCTWRINGELLDSNNKQINQVFESYGEKQVQLRVETYDSVTDTIQKKIYIEPDENELPHSHVDSETEKANVLGDAVNVFQDDLLRVESKNRIVSRLVYNAKENGVDVEYDDIEQHVKDMVGEREAKIGRNKVPSDTLNSDSSSSSDLSSDDSSEVVGEFEVNKEDSSSDTSSGGDSKDEENVVEMEVDDFDGSTDTNDSEIDEEFEMGDETDGVVSGNKMEVESDSSDSSTAETTDASIEFDVGRSVEETGGNSSEEITSDQEKLDVSSGSNNAETIEGDVGDEFVTSSDSQSWDEHDSDTQRSLDDIDSSSDSEDIGAQSTTDGIERSDSSQVADSNDRSTDKLVESEYDDLPSVLEREENIRLWEVKPVREYSDYTRHLYVDVSESYRGVGSESESTGDTNSHSDDKELGATEGVQEESSESVTNPDPITDSELDFEAVGDEHTTVRISPEHYDLGESVFSMPNYTQDLLDFEYVLDEDDDLAPSDANAAGVIAGREGEFIAIARIEGIDWSINTAEKKKQIIDNYESHFLSGLDSHVQILSIPTRFDIREHINRVNNVLQENEDNRDEILMNIGRTIYPNWIEGFMSDNDMKEQQFYVVITLSAEQLHQFKAGKDSITSQLADKPVIGGFFERFTDDSKDEISKYQILRELNKRVGRIEASLRRMDITIDRVTERDKALSILYEYYHGEDPESEVFPTGPFTEMTDEPTIAGMDVSEEIDTYEELNKEDD